MSNFLSSMVRFIGRASHPPAHSRLMSSKAPLFVSSKELQELRSSSNVVILDASWHMPTSPRKAAEEFLAKRIPGARFFSVDDVASPHELGLKHMLPTGQIFAEAVENLGITPSSHVVLYDSSGVFSSPRGLFTFKALGHENASILNGGLPCWEAEGLPTESGPVPDVARSDYPPPIVNQGVIRSYAQVVSNSAYDLATQPSAELVLDARSHGRFTGQDPEPRPGLESGHVPHSFSLSFNAFLKTNTIPGSTATYTTLLSQDELRQVLVRTVGEQHAKQIVEGKRPVTTTCGSGMTAAVLWLGLKLISDSTQVALYDESWTGYASRAASKIDKGEN